MGLKISVYSCLFLLLTACQAGNGSQEQKLKADSLATAVLNGDLPLESLANSSAFMYFDEDYFSNGTDIKTLNGVEKIKAQVVSYRVYKNLTLINNRYVFKAKSPLDLQIPNQIFVNFERAFIESNNQVALSKDSIKLELPINFQDSVLTW